MLTEPGRAVTGSVIALAGGSNELAKIASDLARFGAADAIPPGTHRRWRYVIQTDTFEAVVIAWPPGCGLRMHDHRGSLAAIHVACGRLRERYVDDEARSHVRWLTPDATVELPATHVHEVLNLDDDEAISIHVYSPPLGDADMMRDNEIRIPSRDHPAISS